MAVEHLPSSAAAMSKPELTPEEDHKLTSLLQEVSKWSSSFHGGPLNDNEHLFLTRECLLRYLRASKWVLADSITRLETTLLWRREHHIDELNSTQFPEDLKSGKFIPLGNDKNGRPCLYYDLLLDTPELRNTDLTFLSFITERTIDTMPPGAESITVILDLKNVSRADIPSIAKIRTYISAFQDHNPERLGLALATSIPWWFYGIWAIIKLFLDPVVREKVRFNEELSAFVTKERLWRNYGGEMEFDFDDKVFWEEFLGKAREGREQYVERWRLAGKKVGVSEVYLRGGSRPSDVPVANGQPVDPSQRS